jgi:hypothetical protein
MQIKDGEQIVDVYHMRASYSPPLKGYIITRLEIPSLFFSVDTRSKFFDNIRANQVQKKV